MGIVVSCQYLIIKELSFVWEGKKSVDLNTHELGRVICTCATTLRSEYRRIEWQWIKDDRNTVAQERQLSARRQRGNIIGDKYNLGIMYKA